jgi:hypothetical protein
MIIIQMEECVEDLLTLAYEFVVLHLLYLSHL